MFRAHLQGIAVLLLFFLGEGHSDKKLGFAINNYLDLEFRRMILLPSIIPAMMDVFLDHARGTR